MIDNPYFNTDHTYYVFYRYYERYNYQEIKDMISGTGRFHDFSDGNLTTYHDYPQNWHHFTTSCQYDVIIPTISTMMNFGFSKDDFNLVDYYDGEFNLSYLYPKNDYEFSIQMDNDEYIGNYDILIGYKNNIPGTLTKYHTLFRCPHSSCIVRNNSIHTGRRLLVSGDSQCIPQIPIFSCYFDTVCFLDNRNANSVDYRSIEYTDILFSMFDMNCVTKYTNDNFKI